MLTRSMFLGMAVLATLGAACSAQSSDEGDADEAAASVPAVCKQIATYPNKPLAKLIRAQGEQVPANDIPEIRNYTAWPQYNIQNPTTAYDPNIVAKKSDPNEARKNIASRFGGDCQANVEKHINQKKPNVYIYFTGFGDASQNNSLLDEGAILRWINQRDPKALIFSINWSCPESHDGFCRQNADRLKVPPTSPEVKFMSKTIDGIEPRAMETFNQILALTAENQDGYNSALSHSMQMAALLVDQILVADDGGGKSLFGNINFLGYSMGAHAASQVLVQDFTGQGRGFDWTRKGQCDNGSDSCTLAHLSKVKWSLALGLSGWSDALQAHNKFNVDGVPERDAAEIRQYRNGGLYRIKDTAFNGKGNVLNRRMDPTSNSDDQLQRGFSDFLFSDYNHYSHDYSLPIFVNTGFVRALDAFLESKTVTDSYELGILADAAGYVDFDSCKAGEACAASTNYLAHAVNRSHENLTIAHTVPVTLTDGVPHKDRKANNAVTFVAPRAEPIVLNTFEQEDLRGGVELYYRPQFEATEGGTRGLFSYGSCEGDSGELMPQAYVQDGQLVFSMKYLGQTYEAKVPVAQAALAKGKWTHLAFTWNLPVVSLSRAESSTLREDLPKYGQGLVLASGLRKELPSTYGRQQGAGELRIYANGKSVGTAALGTADSKRECLPASEVVSNRRYTVSDGSATQTYNPLIPYANYTAASGPISLGGPVLGTTCKAFKVRNTQAFFGCAKSPTVNAQGDMDDIALVWGPGRTNYDEVDHESGKPKNWNIGVEYNAKPYIAK